MTELLKTGLYHLVEARHGRFLANPKDTYIGRSIIEYGEFSELEWRALDQMIQPGSIVIEAGANMGAHTIPLAKKTGIGGIVYAFEPQIGLFQQLCANLALNDLLNVQAFNAGCGDEPAWLPIRRLDVTQQNNYGGFALEMLKGGGETKVRVERLDDAIDPPRLDLIKADVEGMEPEVLKGAAGLIKQFRPLLYLEANLEDAPRLIRQLEAMDYKAWWHLPLMFNPDNHSGKAENLFGTITSKNMLCVPSEREMNIVGLREVAGPGDHPSNWTA